MVTTTSRRRPKKRCDAFIRTSPDGRISFSIIAYQRIGSPDKVEILLDRRTGQLGFRPAASDRPTWYVSTATPGSAVISCARVLDMLNLRRNSHVFSAEIENNTLVVNTRRTVVTARSISTRQALGGMTAALRGC
jgi:hypothetical protein